MQLKTVKQVFLIGGYYDLVLGLAFAAIYQPIYNHFQIELPNHPAYIQLPGLFIAVFGVGFLLVARDPQRHAGIIMLGVLMKLAFVIVVVGHRLTGGIPTLYLPFAAMDAVFAALFLAASRAVKTSAH
jgi:hypothetical protein